MPLLADAARLQTRACCRSDVRGTTTGPAAGLLVSFRTAPVRLTCATLLDCDVHLRVAVL